MRPASPAPKTSISSAAFNAASNVRYPQHQSQGSVLQNGPVVSHAWPSAEAGPLDNSDAITIALPLPKDERK